MSKRSRKKSGDNKSTMSKKSKITAFTHENVSEEVQLVLEQYGNTMTILQYLRF